MKTFFFSIAAALCCAALFQAETAAPSSSAAPAVEEPLAHKNLQIFLITGDDRLTEVEVKTLDEAMKEKSVIVHETGSVNQLSIENKGKKGFVLVQAGDIVKGGRQDRTLGSDLLVSAKSGKLPLEAFCVESGRWVQRQGESAAAFSGSSKTLNSKELKYAAKVSKDQGKVWDNVARAQKKLSDNVSKAEAAKNASPAAPGTNPQTTQVSVNDTRSATSLQLSLENTKLKELAQEYTGALQDAPEKEARSVGFAYAVNGEMSAAEIYANHALFMKLWNKLLEAAVHEAIAEQKNDTKGDKTISREEAQQWLAEAETTTTMREKHPAANVTLKKDAKKTVRFDTLVPASKGAGQATDDDWIHRSVLSKEGMLADSPPRSVQGLNSSADQESSFQQSVPQVHQRRE